VAEKRPRVWICDDSPTEAAITERTLGGSYDFEKFVDGSIVVERLTGNAPLPDLLLLDWVMPGMPGDEVCRFLRSHEHTRALPIILVTASRVETADVVAGLAAGANDYVARPFEDAELRARVDAAIRSKQLADAAANERARLAAVNQLGHALLVTATRIDTVLDHFATTLSRTLCDGCAVVMLPGTFAAASTFRHRAEESASLLASIATLADPAIHSFVSNAEASATLPPIYHPYIERFGLRSLAILPFPSSEPIQGVVTVTRDAGSPPFEPEDIATIETCIEYAGLAVLTALRFDSERAARAQLDSVLAHLPIGIIVTDTAGTITFVNGAATMLIPGVGEARSTSQIYTLAEWWTLDGKVLTESEWGLRRALYANQSTQSELEMILPGARAARGIAISSVPLRDGRGEVVGTVNALDDVTAQRAIAAERERVAEFQQQMLAIVGHDLRNPLSAFVTGVDILKETLPADTSNGKLVRRLDKSTQRMTRMVEQLLDITRARLGTGIPVARREIELGPLVTTVADELALAYPNARIELGEIEPVSGAWDPDRISQVVSNLLSNAIQYGRPDSPIIIELATSPTVATIAITNQVREAPLAADQLATLFEPYRRGAGSAQHSGGLGLGLFIVRELVRAHGGTIEVDSTTAGTTFRVQLPYARA
jgi:signal transduction histidine kinase/DNA-binding response OmpR family regulator